MCQEKIIWLFVRDNISYVTIWLKNWSLVLLVVSEVNGGCIKCNKPAPKPSLSKFYLLKKMDSYEM